jgi:hypothetical protein
LLPALLYPFHFISLNSVPASCISTKSIFTSIFIMDVYYAYNFASAAWMCLEALPLIASPTIITTLLSPEVRESTGTLPSIL